MCSNTTLEDFLALNPIINVLRQTSLKAVFFIHGRKSFIATPFDESLYAMNCLHPALLLIHVLLVCLDLSILRMEHSHESLVGFLLHEQGSTALELLFLPQAHLRCLR